VVFDHLQTRFGQSTGVLFVSLSSHEAIKQTSKVIIRSLIAQILPWSQRVPEELMAAREQQPSSKVSSHDLWTILHTQIASFERVYIVVDALDEYDGGVSGFLEDFRAMLDLPNINPFLTSRPTYVNLSRLKNYTEIEMQTGRSAIDRYVRTALERSRNYSQLSASLQSEIRAKIVARSDGM
jgi:hypothetical protein